MTETITRAMPIEKARELAAEYDLGADVEKALHEADALGYNVVDFELTYGVDGTSTLAIGRHEGVMISLTVPSKVGEAYALPGGEPIFEFHITIVYLGDLDELDVEQQQLLIGIVNEVARDWKTMEGTLSGLGIFEGKDGSPDALYVGVQIVGLAELRATLIRKLEEAGLPFRDDFEYYQPHMTVGYLPDDFDDAAREMLLATAVTPSDVRFSKLTAAIGGAHYDAQFFRDGFWGEEAQSGPNSTGDGWLSGAPSAYRPGIQKAAQTTVTKSEQFTLGVWYVPDFVDAHGDWIEKSDLEASFHDYMANADRSLRLQHNTEIVAGTIVEGYIQRSELEVDIPDPDTGALVKHVYPAGTPFLGVKWDDWAWPLVEAGEIRGYSIGGTAQHMGVDLGPDAAGLAAA